MHGGRGADTFDAQDGFANDEVDGGPGADDCTNVDAGDQLINC